MNSVVLITVTVLLINGNEAKSDARSTTLKFYCNNDDQEVDIDELAAANGGRFRNANWDNAVGAVITLSVN